MNGLIYILFEAKRDIEQVIFQTDKVIWHVEL